MKNAASGGGGLLTTMRFYRILSAALHNGRRFGPHHPKGGEAMRITLHIGPFTVTIIVKKRENRHPGR